MEGNMCSMAQVVSYVLTYKTKTQLEKCLNFANALGKAHGWGIFSKWTPHSTISLS